MRQRPQTRKHFLRRSRHVLCYWVEGKLIFENYAARVRIHADPLTCTLLDFFDHWRPIEELYPRFPLFSPSSIRKALRKLVGSSLLEESVQKNSAHGSAHASWESWNPAAGFFHFSTKDVQYTADAAQLMRRLQERGERWRVPSPVKHHHRSRQIRLPAPQCAGEFSRVLLSRRTWRQFSKKSIELWQLATLLHLTWGVQRWVRVRGMGRLALKTSPSGGARHPIEVYVLALRVADLPRGLYHYASDTHRLELVKHADLREAKSFLPAQPWSASAGAWMLMTAVFPRCQWKYRSPRAYRAVLIDAGHVCQTFCLVATWLGLAPFCTLALADSRIEKALGVDGVTESVIYAAGVGARPDKVGAVIRRRARGPS